MTLCYEQETVLDQRQLLQLPDDQCLPYFTCTPAKCCSVALSPRSVLDKRDDTVDQKFPADLQRAAAVEKIQGH